MHRVLMAPEALDSPVVTLPQSAVHYVTHVLRLQAGDEIHAFDGTGRECRIRLTSVSVTSVQGEILTRLAVTSPPKPLILGQGLPKGAKMDVVIEKCSELGLTTLVPLYTTRTVVREVSARIPDKMARWQRIAEAAARQCGRPTLLDIHTPMSLPAFCTQYGMAPVKILCWEEEQQRGLRQVLEATAGQSPAVIVVGPEGGFTAQEAASACRMGFVSVNLGSRLLRTETAAIILTGIIRYHWGEIGPERP